MLANVHINFISQVLITLHMFWVEYFTRVYFQITFRYITSNLLQFPGYNFQYKPLLDNFQVHSIHPVCIIFHLIWVEFQPTYVVSIFLYGFTLLCPAHLSRTFNGKLLLANFRSITFKSFNLKFISIEYHF